MEIKQLTTPEEIRQAHELSSMAFHFSLSDDPIEKNPHEDFWGAVEGDRVLSCIIVLRYEMMYHGKYMLTFGIGGVTTRAECRNRGYIRFHSDITTNLDTHMQ